MSFIERERSLIRQIEGHTLEAEEKSRLSPRKIQILEKAAMGLSNREISEELEGISEQAVKNHFSQRHRHPKGIFVRLNVRSRREAVVKVIAELRLLDPEKLVREEELEKVNFLSERQMEIFSCLTDLSLPPLKTLDNQIAEKVGGISPRTVRNHLASIYKKLEIEGTGRGLNSTRAAVIFLAYQRRKESVVELSPKQKEVLEPLARGLNNNEIANEFDISKKGVESRIHKLYFKFKINGRSLDARLQLVKMAIQRGYLPPETDLSPFEPPPFTPGEKEVLGLLILGEENEEIARKLGVPWNKVKKYYNPIIFRKLGVETRTEVMIKALSEGLVDSASLKEKFADQIARLETVSPREREVLRYGIAQGLFNKEIARSLRIPIHVVEARIRRIFKKLDVKNRTQAALIFLLEHPPVEPAKGESTSPSHERLHGHLGVVNQPPLY